MPGLLRRDPRQRSRRCKCSCPASWVRQLPDRGRQPNRQHQGTLLPGLRQQHCEESKQQSHNNKLPIHTRALHQRSWIAEGCSRQNHAWRFQPQQPQHLAKQQCQQRPGTGRWSSHCRYHKGQQPFWRPCCLQHTAQASAPGKDPGSSRGRCIHQHR